MPGVYLSYPFCGQKCTYCNFASGVLPRALEPSYTAALRAELRATQWPWTPNTVYWGGGSPSRMAPGDLAEVLALIPGAPWPEATIEAAPSEITAESAREWARLGINLASLGVQSFVTKELRQTGRTHDAARVAQAVADLRAAGISNINLDLIACLQHQTA